MLPVSSTQSPLGTLDALFTATSAVCVTGLIVVDTADHFSQTGQFIIMALIQIGGIGILTFATWILMLSGRRPGLMEQSAATMSYGHARGVSLGRVLLYVFLGTVVIESLGWVSYFYAWREAMGRPEAGFQALFHTVSAFCNAGFTTLAAGSMAPYASDWWISLTTAALVIAGGLGFLVLAELARRLIHREHRHLSLHSQVVLRMTLILLVLGSVGLLALEWDGALGHLPWHGRLLAAFFQSMTARTAGFNTIEMGDLAPPALFMIILLMIIGASPGSAAGGIKTTTLAILLALVRSQAYGRSAIELRERRLPAEDVARALATFALYMLTLIVGLILLMLAQGHGMTPREDQAGFLALLFEATSALGTVGLSLDWTTSQLNSAGRVVVIALMICGRLGPIIIFLTLIGRPATRRFQYPEESVMTG